MRTLEFPKVKWQNIVIVLLLLSLMAGTALPAMADVIKIRPLAISRSVTLVVAANDAPALSKAQADYVCDGTDDHVQVQAAIDALPVTGGKVALSSGTFNVEVAITLDSNQTLVGCGRNTILTTSTNDLIFLSATGTSGSEKTGIVISDLQIDGGAGYVSDCGIYFEYVDYSFIQNVYSSRHASGTGSYWSGIYLTNSDSNTLIGNTCHSNTYGINIRSSSNNTVSGNTCHSNSYGIYLDSSSNNTVFGNTCQGNDTGIFICALSNNNTISGNTCQGNYSDGINISSSDNNAITGNTCQGNSGVGIYLYSSKASDNNAIIGNTCHGNLYGIFVSSSNHNTILGNTCHGNDRDGIRISSADNNIIGPNNLTENSQASTNAYDDIYLTTSDYNLIQGNLCRAGALANVPRYGINIADVACDGNLVINNDLYDDGFGTAPYNDSGTGTIYVEPGIDDTPVNGELAQPISSNWAFDHNILTFGVHGIPADPGADRYLMWDDVPGELVWGSPAGGGDVVGPGSSTDNAIARFHETTGKIIQDYTSNPPTISDTGDMNIDGDLDVENIVVSGNVDGVDVSVHDTATTGVHGLGSTSFAGVETSGQLLKFITASHALLLRNVGPTPHTSNIVAIAGSTVTVTAGHGTKFFNPYMIGSSYMHLWNTTRGTDAWISSSDGTHSAPGDILTLTATVPVGWQNGDALLASVDGTSEWMELDCSPGIAAGAVGAFMELSVTETGALSAAVTLAILAGGAAAPSLWSQVVDRNIVLYSAANFYSDQKFRIRLRAGATGSIALVTLYIYGELYPLTEAT